MLADFFEARSGRTQEFFRLLKVMALLIVGPSAALQWKHFCSELGELVVIAAIGIYAEASLTSLVHFVDAIRFWHSWRTRHESQPYTRRLRGFNLPNFIVPLHETETGMQIIWLCGYLRVAILVVILALVIALLSFLFPQVDPDDPGKTVAVELSLFLLVTIGIRGNLLTALIFLIERLSALSFISIQPHDVRIIISVLYTFWINFQSVILFSRIRVYTSSDPRLRALANARLLPVTTDVAVSTKENRFGQIDRGKMYINLREDCGLGVTPIDKERVAQDVTLGNIMRLSSFACGDCVLSSNECSP